MLSTPRRIAVSLGAAALLGSACAAEEPAGENSPEGPLVVATTSIFGDVVRSVAAEEARVEVLMPLGVDPHGFEPSPREAARLREADLVVAGGMGLEESLAGVLEATEREEANVLELAPELDPLPLGEATEHGHEEEAEHAYEDEDDHAGGLDPHVWLDPVRMADAARLVAARLEEVAPGDWERRAEAYAADLDELDREIRDLLEPVPPDRRELVTNHDALGYFAGRYDLRVIGVVIPGGSTLAEPSAEEFSELAALIRERDVPAIFAETTQPARLAEAVAAEVGREVRVVELYTESLGEEGSGAETYLEMMRANARRVAEALG